MTNLTIAVDTSPLHGHRTGVGVATEHLLAGLRAAPEIAPEPYVISYRARLDPGERRLPLPAALAARIWARSDRPRVDRWLSDVDVVHGTNYTAPPTHRPTVISVYDCWFLEHPELATPAVRRSGAILRRAVARGATVHVSSAATAAKAASLLDTDRIEVIHLGPPTSLDRPLDPATDGAPSRRPRRPFIVAVGTIETRKGFGHLIDAFARLDADVDLVIAGAPGDGIDDVRARIAAYDDSIRRRITLTGPIAETEKIELLRSAELLVYPSLDEGFGFPILEAHQQGCPVVATAAGSIPEIGGDGIETCPVGDAEGLATAIGRVLHDESRRSRLIDAGTINLGRFSWSTTVASMIDLYRRLADEQPRPTRGDR